MVRLLLLTMLAVMSCSTPRRWVRTFETEGPTFDLVGRAHSVREVHALAAGQSFLVTVTPDAAFLPDSGHPLFTSLEVRAAHANADPNDVWILVEEEREGGEDAQGGSLVATSAAMCTEPASGCTRRFRVTMSWPGSAAGARTNVRWTARAELMRYDVPEPPAAARATIHIEPAP